MRFGLSIPPFCSTRQLLDLAGTADRAGWDGVFLWDHLHFDRSMALDVHDPWVLLGAMATATEFVQLGTLVTPLARRRPQVVAKQMVTLDHLSEGRAVLGVGLGEPADDEFEAFGDPGDAVIRGDRLDEALAVIDRAWSGEPFRFDGVHHRIDAHLLPTPVQRPRPKVWVAAMSANARPRRRALAWDGIAPVSGDGSPMTPDALAELLADVRTLGEPRPGWDVVAAWADGYSADDYEAAGATWLVESRWPVGDWVGELAELAAAGPDA